MVEEFVTESELVIGFDEFEVVDIIVDEATVVVGSDVVVECVDVLIEVGNDVGFGVGVGVRTGDGEGVGEQLDEQDELVVHVPSGQYLQPKSRHEEHPIIPVSGLKIIGVN